MKTEAANQTLSILWRDIFVLSLSFLGTKRASIALPLRIMSCHVVLGTLATLGHLPVDVLVGRLDVARLAMDAAARCVSI